MFWKKSTKGLSANIIEDRCLNCGRCVQVCRRGVFESVAANGQRRTVAGSPEKCSGCRKCAVACPQKAIEMTDRNTAAGFHTKK